MKEKLTPQDIFEIMGKNCSFNNIFTAYEKNDCVINALEDCNDLAGVEWTWDEGISKLVLIFKSLGFVIKIPYTGVFDDECDDHPCDICSCCGCDYTDIYQCSRIKNWNGNDEKYGEFLGAGLDVPNIKHDWDYCEKEAYLYSKAIVDGVDICFAGIVKLGEIDGHPIYTQPLAAIYSDCYSSTCNSHSEEERISTRRACERVNGWCFNVNWLTDFIIYFGDNVFQKFMEFIKKQHISDLHASNVGYIDGVPVLVDYSGFDN